MIESLEIRESQAQDLALIERLYEEAFPDEDLLPLVRDLLSAGPPVLSLVGAFDENLVGHVVFTSCGLVGGPNNLSLLAPLAVTPARQRQGIGKALVHAGLQRLKEAETTLVCVLGDPAYYGRFGFATEADIAPPYPLPDEWHGAWQSLALGHDAPPLRGKLAVPELWRRKELWAP